MKKILIFICSIGTTIAWTSGALSLEYHALTSKASPYKIILQTDDSWELDSFAPTVRRKKSDALPNPCKYIVLKNGNVLVENGKRIWNCKAKNIPESFTREVTDWVYPLGGPKEIIDTHKLIHFRVWQSNYQHWGFKFDHSLRLFYRQEGSSRSQEFNSRKRPTKTEINLFSNTATSTNSKQKVSIIETEFKARPSSDRKLIQSTLKKKGHYNFTIDGLWGKGTRTAVERYGSGENLKKQSVVKELYAGLLSEGRNLQDDLLVNTVAMSDAGTCMHATDNSEVAIKWRTDAQGVKFVQEAKARTLECRSKYAYFRDIYTEELSDSREKDLTLVDDIAICNLATSGNVSGNVWIYARKYFSDEAQSRGLTCGVDNNVAGNTDDLKQCPLDKSEWFHNCFGTRVFSYGDKYVGEFQNNMENGKGKVVFLADNGVKGGVLEGTFVDGFLIGKGSFSLPDGTSYKGLFKENQFHGQGTFISPNGETYEGNFKLGARSGSGTKKYRDGSTYSGGWLENKWYGKGVYASPKGTYIGEFIEGKFHGYGVLSDKDGKIIHEGQFANNEPIFEDQPTEPYPQSPQNDDKVLEASSGSGFYVSEKGHIVTNHHVIKGCQEINVVANGESFSTKLLAFDEVNDVALLKINTEVDVYLPMSIKSSELLEDVYVAGFPFGVDPNISKSVKVTKGIVSSLTGNNNNYSEIQIDAAIQEGSSGGPILNRNGNVVGVAVSKLSRKYMEKTYGVVPENVNFGVKASVVLNFLNANGVETKAPNEEEIPTKELGKQISKATLYLSCGMTVSQIEKMKNQKVMFNKYE